MTECKSFTALSPEDQASIRSLIGDRACGKANVAYIDISESDLPGYLFQVTVAKYNSVKGWSTIAYIKKDEKGDYKLSFNPRTNGKGRKAGRAHYSYA